MKKLMMIVLAACAAMITGCVAVEVEDYGDEVVKDAAGNPVCDTNGVVQTVRKGLNDAVPGIGDQPRVDVHRGADAGQGDAENQADDSCRYRGHIRQHRTKQVEEPGEDD